MADTDQDLINLGSQWAAAMVPNDAGLIGSLMANVLHAGGAGVAGEGACVPGMLTRTS
ncbi:MAG TPA: hypothetical protein VNA17_07185 [Pyrinomonadaceae bacterium]|nr:hypothetical protein [Pyrinomonadaceae bacterium]